MILLLTFLLSRYPAKRGCLSPSLSCLKYFSLYSYCSYSRSIASECIFYLLKCKLANWNSYIFTSFSLLFGPAFSMVRINIHGNSIQVHSDLDWNTHFPFNLEDRETGLEGSIFVPLYLERCLLIFNQKILPHPVSPCLACSLSLPSVWRFCTQIDYFV